MESTEGNLAITRNPLTDIRQNDDELHAWIKRNLAIDIPRAPLCPEHDAPFEYIRRAYFEPTKDLVVWAPRGGGKTRLGAVATLLDLLQKPGCSIRILGGSFEQSQKMWEHLRDDIERLHGQLEINLAARRITTADGSIAAVLSQSQKAVRGLRVQKLRCDEVEMFDPKVWNAAQLVTKSRRRAPGERGFEIVAGVVEVFSTLHRPWGLMQKIVDAAHTRGTRVIKWCILDVLENCPDSRPCEGCPLHPECGGRARHASGFFSIDDAIALKQRVSADTWEAEMLCLRPSTGNCVFPSFEPTLHVRETVGFDTMPDLWLGIDFGFANPFVCLWIRRYENGVVHVIDEYVRPHQTIEYHVSEIQARKWGKVSSIGCDPAGNAANDQTARSNVDVLRRANFEVRTRHSRIIDGLELLRAALKTGAGQIRLFIHPRCGQLIKAMQAYRYPDLGGEVPLKDGEHDHLIDALRYFYVNSSVGHKLEGRRY